LLELSARPRASARVVVFVDPGDASSDSMGITKILVLGIDPYIGEGVGASTRQPHREDLRCEPKGADFP